MWAGGEGERHVMWAGKRADCRPGPFRLQAATHSAAFLTAVQAKKRSKYTPRSDKVSQTEAQIRPFLVFFVLSREEGSLVSGMERNF
jgi:hypothetical protein